MSIFANAKAPEDKKQNAKKSNKEEIAIKGLEDLAAIDIAIGSLETIRETLEGSVKDVMAAHFVKTGEILGRKPENFRGVEGNAEASCELKRRSSRSVLSDDEVELFKKNNIPYETITDVEACFLINPKYTENAELLEKISNAIMSIEGIPDDLILRQTEKSRHVASDESINAIFKSKTAKSLLKLATTMALKVTSKKADVVEALDHVKKIIAPTKKKDEKGE